MTNTAPVSSVPLSIDYTSRDFYSIREELINLVKARFEGSQRQWSGTDPSDFGVALIEAFAYVGDLTNYYIDRIANETYLPTATQRKSVLNLASLYGYKPTGYRAALVEVTFTNGDSDNAVTATVTGASGNGTTVTYTANNTFSVGDYVTVTGVLSTGVDPANKGYQVTNALVTAATSTTFSVASTFTTTFASGGTAIKSYVIPAGTQVGAEVVCNDVVEELIFTTLQDAVLAPNSEATVYAQHGEDINTRTVGVDTEGGVIGEKIGTSTGEANQRFVLSENQVVDGSVKVYVMAGDVYQPWTEVEHLADYGPSDAVYRTEMDENNFVYVIFGDGVSGSIPDNLASIKADYIVGGGTIGNISSGVINTIIRIPGLNPSQKNAIDEVVDVTNLDVGSGGAEPEDNRSIRVNASQAIRSINRAVSLRDYADLALYATNAGKANATAEVWTSVTLYVAPVRNVGDLTKFPGFDDNNALPTQEWYTLQSAVENLMSNKTQIGVSLTVAPPVYVPVTVSLTYSKNEQYSSAQAEDDLRKAIINGFSYTYMDFEQVITPENIEAALNGLPSIRTARITALHRTGDTAARNTLIGGPAEIFTFLESGLTIAEASNEARLSALTANHGTFSPTFASQVGSDGYNSFYSYNLVVPTGTTSVTFTPTAAAGATVTVNGTTPATAVSTPVGTTTVPIIIVAADNSTVKVYTVTISRAS